jgi:acyl-coenzyme A thioesterase PaaI-like protein
LTVNFLAGGRGQALTADAKVIRRGSSLCYLEVDVTDEAETRIAKGLVTYKLG